MPSIFTVNFHADRFCNWSFLFFFTRTVFFLFFSHKQVLRLRLFFISSVFRIDDSA
jgi:hypothetical protein